MVNSVLAFTAMLLSASSVLAASPWRATPVNDCSAYPGYDPKIGRSAKFSLHATRTDNTTIEGVGTSHQHEVSSTSNPKDPFIASGRVTLLTSNAATIVYECANSTLFGWLPYGRQINGHERYTWQPLYFARDGDAELLYQSPSGGKQTAQAFTDVYIGDILQNGTFVGKDGGLLWGFKYHSATERNTDLSYYNIRTLQQNLPSKIGNSPLGPSQLKEGEFMGFIKVEALPDGVLGIDIGA